MAEPKKPGRAATAAEVAAYLRAHPGFLTAHPELYAELTPPERFHGQPVADHMRAMLLAERGRADAMAARADDVIAAGRAAAGLATRVQDAVLALMQAAGDPAQVADCIALELPMLLAVDSASLCAEGALSGARALPGGLVARLLGGRSVVYRAGGESAALLHGEAVRLANHEALVTIPGNGPPTLLALSSRFPEPLSPANGVGALSFLGRAIAVALGR